MPGAHIAGAIAWHWKDDLHEAPRREFIGQQALVGLLRPLGGRPRHDRRALRRQQQLVCHLRLLALSLPGFDRVRLATLVDVRSPAEFSGEVLAPPHLPQEQAQVPGHIPGAANVPWASAAQEDGSFKTDSELAALYGGVGVTPDTDVIAYCRIGERSSHTWFVLHELLGYERVRNYDGSWTEYGSLVGVPVER